MPRDQPRVSPAAVWPELPVRADQQRAGGDPGHPHHARGQVTPTTGQWSLVTLYTVLRYVDDISFQLTPASSGCAVSAKSRSQLW